MSSPIRFASKTSLARASAGICGIVMLLAAPGVQAGESGAQLVTSFQALCVAEPLDFARSEQKAADMKLSLEQGTGAPPDDSGFFTRSKSFAVVAAVPHEFLISETHGPKGDFKSCGIRSADADAVDFRAELVKGLKLGKPVSEAIAPDGERKMTVWQIGDRTLTLSDKTPVKIKQGVRLLLSNKPL